MMTRSEIIDEARFRAGRKAQAIPLANAFNFITRKITVDYPILRNICRPITTVASQSWIALPSDYRSWEQFFYSTYELDWIEPEEYFRNIRVFTDTASTPQKFTIAEDESRIYLWNKPGAVTPCYFYYSAVHPKVDKTLAFTSGGTYEIKVGDTVTGEASGKTMLVKFVRVTSGSWAGEDAVGWLLGTASGTFQSETLKVGTNSDVATISADATTADNFQHFLGEKFDEVIIEGVTWKCLEYISDKNPTEKALMKSKESDFKDLLSTMAAIKGRRSVKTTYRGY